MGRWQLLEHPTYKNAPTSIAVSEVEDTLKALQDLAEYYLNKYTLKWLGITGSKWQETQLKNMVEH